jgi:hypothetical protein
MAGTTDIHNLALERNPMASMARSTSKERTPEAMSSSTRGRTADSCQWVRTASCQYVARPSWARAWTREQSVSCNVTVERSIGGLARAGVMSRSVSS